MPDKKKKARTEDYDDGRTIADMSLVTRRNLLIPQPFERIEREERTAPVKRPEFVEENGTVMEPEESGKERPWEVSRSLDRKETGAYILGALAAGLSLVLIFILAGGLLILFLLGVWS